MEFMNRGTGRPQQTVSPAPTSVSSESNNHKKRLSDIKGMRVVSIVLLFSVTVLVIALVLYLVFWRNTSEKDYVAKDNMQAIFLNGGQVYFGKILGMNDKYIRVGGIFYLRVNQTVQPKQEGGQQAAPNDISLVKLGCELHRPDNEMLINRDQVIFWENLKKEDGENTIPGAVKKYNEKYPNGQECQDVAQPTTTGDNTKDTSTITP